MCIARGGKALPRQPIYDLPGYAQHVIQRCNNRQAAFFHMPNYGRYLEDLPEVAETTGCLVHAYVSMTNQVNAQRRPPPCQR